MKKKQLHVSIVDKVATFQKRDGDIVCGNSDYELVFTFDSEWDEYPTKIARFIWNGLHTDVKINADNTCPVPMLRNTAELTIGAYAEGIATTTPARIDCVRSILCGDEAPTEEDENYTSEAKEAAMSASASATSAKASANSASASANAAKGYMEVSQGIAADSVNMDARITRNDKRITNLEQGLIPDPFETDASVAYQKAVPANALPFAMIGKVGGMTYDSKNLFPARDLEFEQMQEVNLTNPLPAGTYTLSAYSTSTDTDSTYNLITF